MVPVLFFACVSGRSQFCCGSKLEEVNHTNGGKYNEYADRFSK